MAPRFRFLLVEDDPGHVVLFRRTLERAGIQNPLTVLEDGEDALAFLRGGVGEDVRDPDEALLLLVDLRLPRLDGVSLIREIRSDPALALLPVAVLTTSGEPEEEAVCRALGTVGFLTKPATADGLRAVVGAAGLDPLLDVPEGRRPLPDGVRALPGRGGGADA